MKEFAFKVYVAWRDAKSRSQPRLRWLPWVISIAAIGYVVWRLVSEDSISWTELWPPSGSSLLFLGITLLLLPLNWGLEAEKWRLLVLKWYPSISRKQALQAVLCGLATGIFTPNRVGEYPGRIMTLPPGNRWEAATSMFFDRLIQMIITLWLGIAALLLVQAHLPEAWLSPVKAWLPCIMALCVMVPIAALIFLPRIASFVPGQTIGDRVRQAMVAVTPSLALTLLMLSCLRNAVFSLQYLLLLYAAGLSVHWQLAIPLIWVIFFAKSIVPYWTFTELGIRESIAIAVLSLVGVSAATAFSATFILYLINLVIPALVGLRWVHRISW